MNVSADLPELGKAVLVHRSHDGEVQVGKVNLGYHPKSLFFETYPSHIHVDQKRNTGRARKGENEVLYSHAGCMV